MTLAGWPFFAWGNPRDKYPLAYEEDEDERVKMTPCSEEEEEEEGRLALIAEMQMAFCTRQCAKRDKVIYIP